MVKFLRFSEPPPLIWRMGVCVCIHISAIQQGMTSIRNSICEVLSAEFCTWGTAGPQQTTAAVTTKEGRVGWWKGRGSRARGLPGGTGLHLGGHVLHLNQWSPEVSKLPEVPPQTYTGVDSRARTTKARVCCPQPGSGPDGSGCELLTKDHSIPTHLPAAGPVPAEN